MHQHYSALVEALCVTLVVLGLNTLQSVSKDKLAACTLKVKHVDISHLQCSEWLPHRRCKVHPGFGQSVGWRHSALVLCTGRQEQAV